MNSWVSSDHRIAAKNCVLTTRAAKWATIQVGTGRTVLEVAKELNWNATASMTLLPPTAKRWPRLTRNASIAPAQLARRDEFRQVRNTPHQLRNFRHRH